MNNKAIAKELVVLAQSLVEGDSSSDLDAFVEDLITNTLLVEAEEYIHSICDNPRDDRCQLAPPPETILNMLNKKVAPGLKQVFTQLTTKRSV